MSDTIGWSDRNSFKFLSIGILCLGGACSVAFWALVNPHFKMLNVADMLRKEKRKVKVEKKKQQPPDRLKWFRDPRFYSGWGSKIYCILCVTVLIRLMSDGHHA